MRFSANIVTGSGRGKRLGSPTINLNLAEVPEELEEGVYACYAFVNHERKTNNERRYPAVLHYGPRPTFDGSRSCEVHLIEKFPISNSQFPSKSQAPSPKPQTVTVEVVERLRDVEKFESESALKAQIAEDIAQAKTILGILSL